MPKSVKDVRKFKNKAIMDTKESIPSWQLCRGLPDCIEVLLNYSRHMRFEERPNYSMLIDSFAREMSKRNLEVDWRFSFH